MGPVPNIGSLMKPPLVLKAMLSIAFRLYVNVSDAEIAITSLVFGCHIQVRSKWVVSRSTLNVKVMDFTESQCSKPWAAAIFSWNAGLHSFFFSCLLWFRIAT